jgi:hypothetical protein
MTVKNSSWVDFYNQGIQYMRATEKSVSRKEIFTPVIIYNMSSIAIEKLIMGACMFDGTLPFCHTLSGMAEFSKNILALDEQLIYDMNIMDKMQMICSADDIFCADPDYGDADFFIDVMRRIYVKTEHFIKSGI